VALRLVRGGQAITSTRRAAAVAGAAAGLLAGAAVAWFVASDPGRGLGAPGSLRGDVDAQTATVLALQARVAAVEAAVRAVDEKIAAVAAPAPGAPTATIEQLRTVAQDLKALRDSLAAELQKVDDRLGDLRRRIDEQNAPRAPRGGPLTEEEENYWAARARDSDPGVRCSALTMLGRGRTERSVNVSIDRLADEDPEVVWNALSNLARFKERAAAAQVAPLLDHAAREVRAAAYEALVAMGAPTDTGYNAVASAEKRKPAADALKKWSESP
jgi:HEAT repeat protein